MPLNWWTIHWRPACCLLSYSLAFSVHVPFSSVDSTQWRQIALQVSMLSFQFLLVVTMVTCVKHLTLTQEPWVKKIFLMTKWNIGRHCLKKEWGKQSTSEVTLGPLIPIPSSNHTLKKVHHKTYCDNPLTLKEIARSYIASTRTLSCKLVSTLEANTLCRLCWIAGSINIWSICMFTSQAD